MAILTEINKYYILQHSSQIRDEKRRGCLTEMNYQEGCKVEKVKIFADRWDSPTKGFAELEKRVNEWLKQNPDITVTDRQMSSFYGVDPDATAGAVGCTIAIFYVPASRQGK